jgi:hypothetical protein
LPLRPRPFAAGADEAGVKGVIQQFQQALQRRDVAAIEALVSPDVVVLENGHRNQGWADFSDNHLIPEFREFEKVVASSEMGWGLPETDDRRDWGRRQARRLLGLVCLRPSENRIHVEDGFAGLECKSTWFG